MALSNNDILKVPRHLRGTFPDRSSVAFFERLENFCTGWDDIIMPLSGLTVSSQIPDIITFYGTGSLKGYGFAGAGALTEELIAFEEMDHDWIEGTDIYPHIHWMPTTAGAGNVKWGLEYAWFNVNETNITTDTIYTTPRAAGGTAWTGLFDSFGAIDGSGKKIGSQLHFRIFRDPTDAADTYAADAAGLTLGVHYRANSIGSEKEFVK